MSMNINTDLIYGNGYSACKSGVPRHQCPNEYFRSGNSHLWLHGWDAAHKEIQGEPEP